MVLKAVGKMIVLISKLLIVGDSVMGCFVKAPGDGDSSPDAVSLVLVRIAVRVLSPRGEWSNLAGTFPDPSLPARRPVLP